MTLAGNAEEFVGLCAVRPEPAYEDEAERDERIQATRSTSFTRPVKYAHLSPQVPNTGPKTMHSQVGRGSIRWPIVAVG